METRRVKELSLAADGVANVGGFDAITLDWGCNGRFNLTPNQLAANPGWHIIGTAEVPNYVAHEAATWIVLMPQMQAIDP